jgi:predicted nicotinamide N-methyase
MECWSTLVTQPKPSALQQAQQLAYVKYTAPVPASDGVPSEEHRSNRTITTSESRGLILSAGTTGFRTWEAALHLGSFLSTPAGQALVRGNRVIELGAGTGFLSMFCAKHLGVQSVVATDREPALIESIRDCMRRNELDPAVFQPAIWEWGTPLSLTQSELEEGEGDAAVSGSGDLAFDVALGADLIYDVDLVPLLVSTLRDLFENYHLREFIISATLRNQDTFQTFLNACGECLASIRSS